MKCFMGKTVSANMNRNTKVGVDVSRFFNSPKSRSLALSMVNKASVIVL